MRKNIIKKSAYLFLLLYGTSVFAADELTNVQPVTAEERELGQKILSQNLHDRIEVFGKNLKSDDFEMTWKGRQLNKQKRQEVCGIYQGVINDMYKLAQENRARLTVEEQKIIDNRDTFIQSLGFKDNIVDTQMGFNCRLR